MVVWANQIGPIGRRSTAETHFESGMRLINGGAGAVTPIGALGVISFSGTANQFERETGFQSYFAFDAQVGSINLHLGSQHTFGAYNDLASLSARCVPLIAPVVSNFYPYPLSLFADGREPNCGLRDSSTRFRSARRFPIIRR